MTDNVQAKDGVGNAFTLRAKDLSVGGDGSLQGAMSIPMDAAGNPAGVVGNPLVASDAIAVVAASFNRPADTTAYTTGDLVANSTTAGSVVPLQFAVAAANGRAVRIARARLTKSGTTVTNATFRAHIYKLAPTPANGDNGAWSTNQALAYLGSFTLDMTAATARVFTDGAKVIAVPDVGSEIIADAASGTQLIFALLEARAAYTPVSGETFTLALEAKQN